ncbi:tRNA pseudouridine(38-40) synthase TruA [Penaeicola halotolerans]|uniref:tRNA pseudouridine(38-40) synthase TruA n=1 Tax=Penaeicola halotolerans TaxID=2793196 RepID=UPI001CF87290|nr:tRNA pseudouridine(38-40) synthase TruA [Penaeicola halotolerans]
MRYFLEIAYRGTDFHGWQVQHNAHSVQGELNKCLSTLLQTEITTTASGRTDTGVHCKQQFVHIDLEEAIDTDQLCFKLNKLLPESIHIARIFPVKDDAHARFSALDRSYQYFISKEKNPFLHNLCYFNNASLDIAAMNEAAKVLLSWTDFESFSKVKTSVYTFDCKITEAYWEQKEDLLIFNITANRFLRGMVRAIVGTLLEVGKGKLKVEDFQAILAAKDRKKAGRSVPPEGLFLTKVTYPTDIF